MFEKQLKILFECYEKVIKKVIKHHYIYRHKLLPFNCAGLMMEGKVDKASRSCNAGNHMLHNRQYV